MPTNQKIDIPLHDIKPLVEVHEYSLYYFIALSTLVTLLLAGAVYLLYRWYKHRKRINIRAEHLKALHTIDMDDTKQAAYAITRYGATFKDDGQRQREMYANVLERLTPYKYKKQVESFDEETRSYIDLYLGMIDV